jgi:hypothetical protein
MIPLVNIGDGTIYEFDPLSQSKTDTHWRAKPNIVLSPAWTRCTTTLAPVLYRAAKTM